MSLTATEEKAFIRRPTAPRNRTKIDRSKLPPGPGGPGIWQSLNWLLRPESYLRECTDRYGETFTFDLVGLGTFVSFSNPEHVKQIFTGNVKTLHAGEGNMVLEPVVGKNSLLTIDEDVHLRQRRLMLPPFHGERMQTYLDRIDEIANDEMDKWSPGDRFALRDKTRDVALNVILEVIFGLGHEDEARKQQFREGMVALDPVAYQRMMTIPVQVRLPGGRDPHSRFTRGKAALDALIMDEVERRRRDPDAAERDDVLSMMLQARDEDGQPMTDQELLDQLTTLVVAGHETTSTSLSWTFELLYRHPEVMRRATEEAKAGGYEYIDAVIKESLRIRPAVSMAVRLVKQPIEIGGYELPAGVAIGANLFVTHRNPEIYPDPLAFKPERFLDNGPDTYSWYPFGGGTRRCLGASFAMFEMRTILSAILRRAELRSPDGPGAKPERIVRRAVVTLAPRRDTRTVVSAVAAR
ncbi:MAG: cytochrome P450 [Actinobacteria bacterium]|nr:cytochrome P450 [Actinomycetota bacterium]